MTVADERNVDVVVPGANGELAVQELCRLSVRFDHFQIFPTALGTRLVAVAGGGRLEGPHLHGEVLPGGGDWLLLGEDGIARMDVRASVRTTEGAAVYLTAIGRAVLGDEARERFLRGETVSHPEVHARLALAFEAGGDTTAWLNATVAVGLVDELSQQHIDYRVYAVS